MVATLIYACDKNHKAIYTHKKEGGHVKTSETRISSVFYLTIVYQSQFPGLDIILQLHEMLPLGEAQ